MKFYDLPKKLEGLHITFDGDKTDLRLHSDENFNWGAKYKKDYKKACKAIDNIDFSGEGWKVYGWYDISSFEYWMKDMKEQNYIQISIAFDNEDVKDEEIENIYNAIDAAYAMADEIQYKYDFNPEFD